MSVRADYIKFGNTASVERYLEQRCSKSLQYLKEKGVLHLVAEDFANQSISTKFGDMPFNNKLVLILTDSNSGLDMDSELITRSITPTLTTYLKEYVQEGEVKQLQNEDNQTSSQNGNRNHVYYLVVAVTGVALAIFVACRFGSSSTD